ncbi:unnamed protein product [Chondrus crispus]|uniref:Uncharacterized protein n=1 Tax=Chondrus crispus TaxID=2769 RepID=R7QR70_CHOCR|nr:unnamed protein product [Chondrus crispus]CDF40634.1 unnamed protein product [Chondrus crispus]|eukprot:XP_005710928.1 unnamed protein product [Chondrus crispus]
MLQYQGYKDPTVEYSLTTLRRVATPSKRQQRNSKVTYFNIFSSSHLLQGCFAAIFHERFLALISEKNRGAPERRREALHTQW